MGELPEVRYCNICNNWRSWVTCSGIVIYIFVLKSDESIIDPLSVKP